MVRDAMRLAESMTDDHIELREILHEIAGERDGINRRKMGRWIIDSSALGMVLLYLGRGDDVDPLSRRRS